MACYIKLKKRMEARKRERLVMSFICTIGLSNINYVRLQVQAELIEQMTFPFLNEDYSILRRDIIDRLSGELFDIWEGAYAEILEIIDEELSTYCHNVA